MIQQLESHHFAEEEEAFCVTLAIHLAAEIAHARAKGALENWERESVGVGKRKLFYTVCPVRQESRSAQP